MIKLLAVLILLFCSRLLFAGCAAFDQDRELAKIPVVVKGVVISSELLITPGPKLEKHQLKGMGHAKKTHLFSFKITKSQKGYMRKGDVISFKYPMAEFACPSTQVPQLGEQWVLNVREVNRENEAVPYGTTCGYLGRHLSKK